MKVLSWNIQCGLGCDGIRSVERICDYLKSYQDLDIICLQEVSRNFPEYSSAGAEDQLKIIEKAFSGYSPVWGSGMHWLRTGFPPLEFGNLTLVKSGLLDWRVHPLPRPAGVGKMQMPRCLVESVVDTTGGPLTILNTHLAYHNELEQQEQIGYLHRFLAHQEENWRNPVLAGNGAYADLFRAIDTLLCGDLNILPLSPLYQKIIAGGWVDGFLISNRGQEHPYTCGVHDKELWSQGPHCRDYFMVSSSLSSAVVEMVVDGDCDYSDHQPILLTLALK